PADIVECSTPHNAQLVGRRVYSQEMSYPGEDELLEDSESFCADITLLENTQATYSISTSRPSQYTWDSEDDRRVHCILSTTDESHYTESLDVKPRLAHQPPEQDQSEDPIEPAEAAASQDSADAPTVGDGPSEAAP